MSDELLAWEAIKAIVDIILIIVFFFMAGNISKIRYLLADNKKILSMIYQTTKANAFKKGDDEEGIDA